MRKFVVTAECTMIVTVHDGEDIDEQIDRELDALSDVIGRLAWEIPDARVDEIDGIFA